MDFKLTCSCGSTISGAFFNKESYDRLHCVKCGLVWQVSRPIKFKE